MSKSKFIGIILITAGLLFVIIGLILTLMNSRNLSNPTTSDSDQSEADGSSQPSNLIINLPAPDSIVASPLLIRGKVYGEHDKLLIKLISDDEQVLVDTASFAGSDEESPGTKPFQTSLVFSQPDSATGVLHFQLVTDTDEVIEEEQIPVTFRK